MKKIIIILFCTVIFFIIVAFVFYVFMSKNDQPSEQAVMPLKLKIGMMPIVDVLQLYIAQENGFFKEENLEIEMIPMAGGAVMGPAMAAGDIDIGWINSVTLAIAHEQGFDFKILSLGSFVDSEKGRYADIIISKPGINSPQECEGGVFAVNTFKNINDLNSRVWLSSNGVNLENVTFVEMPFPEMEAALSNDAIRCACVTEPYKTSITENGTGRVLDDKAFIFINDRFLIASWIASEAWINNNRQKADAFKSAIAKATDYILSHPDEYKDIIPKYTKLSEDLAGKISMPVYQKEIKREELQSVVDACREHDFIKKELNADDLLDINLVFAD